MSGQVKSPPSTGPHPLPSRPPGVREPPGPHPLPSRPPGVREPTGLPVLSRPVLSRVPVSPGGAGSAPGLWSASRASVAAVRAGRRGAVRHWAGGRAAGCRRPEGRAEPVPRASPAEPPPPSRSPLPEPPRPLREPPRALSRPALARPALHVAHIIVCVRRRPVVQACANPPAPCCVLACANPPANTLPSFHTRPSFSGPGIPGGQRLFARRPYAATPARAPAEKKAPPFC